MCEEGHSLEEVITCLREAVRSVTSRSGGYPRHSTALIGDQLLDPSTSGSVPNLTRRQVHAACDAVAAEYEGDAETQELIEDVRGFCDGQLRGGLT